MKLLPFPDVQEEIRKRASLLCCAERGFLKTSAGRWLDDGKKKKRDLNAGERMPPSGLQIIIIHRLTLPKVEAESHFGDKTPQAKLPNNVQHSTVESIGDHKTIG